MEGNGNEEEEIVGWAAWEFVTGRKEGDPWRAEREVPEGEDNPFGPGANVEFCEDVFHAADKQMEKACKGRDYASKFSHNLFFLNSTVVFGMTYRTKRAEGQFLESQLTLSELGLLVVSPKCQRRGVGTMLLAEGLKEVDTSGLQCVLGASPEGRNLYKRFGFEDFSIKVLHMSRFEGGEGMEDDEHVVMHRPLLKMMD